MSAAKVRVKFHQCTRDAVTDRTGLSGRAAAVDIYQNVEFLGRFRQVERLTNDHLQSFVREVGVKLALVDLDLARARDEGKRVLSRSFCGLCRNTECLP